MGLKLFITCSFLLLNVQASSTELKLRSNISNSFYLKTIIPYSNNIKSLYAKLFNISRQKINREVIIQKTSELNRRDLYMNFYFDVIKSIDHSIQRKSLSDLKKMPLEKINLRINEMAMVFARDKKIPLKHRQIAKRIHAIWSLLLMNIIKK